MLVGRIEQLPGTVVHVIGKSQGYFGLPVRYEIMWDSASGRAVPTMTTAWFPDPDELRRINEGEAIHLRLFGENHPPMYISVGGAQQFDTKQANVELLELALLEWTKLRDKFVKNGNVIRSMDILMKGAIDQYFRDKQI